MTSSKLLLHSASAAVLAVMIGAPAFAQTAAPAAPLPEAGAAPATAAVGEIVVTGTRLVTGFTAPTPVSVVGSAQIESRGAVNISDVVQEIPAFIPSGQTQGTSGTFAVGQSLFNLRGLGATRTLVLVDGRRPTPNNSNGTFDTNMLPTSLIDRSDVVTGGASAAYGSDAIAGVVNFVLKDKLEGFTGSAQYGQSDYSDTRSRAVSLGFGHAWMDGKLRLIAGGDLSRDDPAPTMYGRPWGQNEPGLVPLTASRPAGVPANLITNNSEYALGTGSIITSCVAGGKTLAGSACPVGNLTFSPSGTPTPFAFGSLVGSTLQVSPGGVGDYGYDTGSVSLLKAGGQRATFLGRLSYELNDNNTLYAEYRYGSFKEHSSGTYPTKAANTLIVNSDNPYIPSQLAAQMAASGVTQIKMSALLADGGASSINNLNFYNEGTIGGKGSFAALGDSWKWDASYTMGTSQFRYDNYGLILNNNFDAALYAVRNSSGQIVCGPIATNPNASQLTAAQIATIQPGCQPYNPFGLGAASKASVAYYQQEMFQYTRYARNSAQVNISGTPFMLPAGPVSVAVGAEWHKDNLNVYVPIGIEALSVALDYSAVNPRTSQGHSSAKEVYGEIGVPILKDMPFFKTLDLNAAFRHTDYNPSGPVNTWKLGGTWDVNDFLRIRATRSRDIRAPNIVELFVQGNAGFGLTSNPATGVSAQVNTLAVPNASLKPEVAETWTGGFVLQPVGGLLSGLRASVDYWDIQVNGVIATVSATQVLQRYYLQHDQSYAPFITFDNSAIGFSLVKSPFLNQNSLKTNGVDFDFAYRVPQGILGTPGRFNLTARGTWTLHDETYGVTGTPLNSTAYGGGDLANYIGRWKWTVNLNWDLGRFSNYLQMRTNSHIEYSLALIGPDNAAYNPTISTSINKNQFPAMAYFSYGAQYTLINGDNRRLSIYGVVDNLMNKNPPFASAGVLLGLGTGGSGGYDPYDNIGRYYKVGIRFQY